MKDETVPLRPRPPSDGPPSDRVAARARSLTPEEQEAGVDDPRALAEAVLADSDARTADREGTAKEHRHSEDTVEPHVREPDE